MSFRTTFAYLSTAVLSFGIVTSLALSAEAKDRKAAPVRAAVKQASAKIGIGVAVVAPPGAVTAVKVQHNKPFGNAVGSGQQRFGNAVGSNQQKFGNAVGNNAQQPSGHAVASNPKQPPL